MVLWIVRTGSPWRDLPTELELAHDIHAFQALGESGVWRRVVEAVRGDRDLDMLMIDSAAVRARQHAAGAQKKKGRKR